MTSYDSRIEGEFIEKIIAKIFNGELMKCKYFDITANGIIEVKSFYFFWGKNNNASTIRINKKTFEMYRHKLRNDNCRFILVGKTKKKYYPIRMVFVVTWKEMDELLKKYGRKIEKKGRGMYYSISWTKLLQAKCIRCIEKCSN